MQYKRFGKSGENVSILGYGCMRFPKRNGKPDIERIEKQIMMAVEAGVTYFDTAYIYLGNEAILGQILEKRQIREKVKIATKIPPYLAQNRASMESILNTQLKRLRTSYFDFYLVHALTDITGWEKTKAAGLMAFLEDKKREGIIKNIGFSYHGDSFNFKKIVDDYLWDFCMVQYNYIDENSQAGREGVRHAHAKGLGVAVMEPLRGGSLAGRMPDVIRAIWDKSSVQRSPAEWALRWLWDQPEVDLVLSGMNNEEHILENIRIANEAKPGMLTSGELRMLEEVREAYLKVTKVSCTGCSYCIPCPAGVNIPMSFSFYNDHHLFHQRFSRAKFLMFLGDAAGSKSALPSECTECGKCERHCPQQLPIRKLLKSVKTEMEPWWSKPFLGMIKRMLTLRRR